MSISPAVLFAAKQAETSVTTQYTVTTEQAVIGQMSATNVSAGNAALTVYLVPAGGSASLGNMIIPARIIAPGEVYNCPEIAGAVIRAGEAIATTSSASGALVIRASGYEYNA
jgi:hypothetical protein